MARFDVFPRGRFTPSQQEVAKQESEMAQLAMVGLLGVLLTVAAIVWRNRSSQTGENTRGCPNLGSVGGVLRVAGGRSLPIEGFEDWKLHYLRIAISVLPSGHRPVSRLGRAGAALAPALIENRRDRPLRGLGHADEG